MWSAAPSMVYEEPKHLVAYPGPPRSARPAPVAARVRLLDHVSRAGARAQ